MSDWVNSVFAGLRATGVLAGEAVDKAECCRVEMVEDNRYTLDALLDGHDDVVREGNEREPRRAGKGAE